ncbi:hypothetical protein [Cyanobium sp. ATX 6F1]|uniref:hypothetical protein n=1 Tax=unclassified Cyanobium TaxID=2627006 RepID=UPI0020CE3DBF|nr:hypothetical protein [Cyanobium sp. ATX 6F1]MCP9915606.1 hypothetical protein [Cyanobium sp. ATX 6F1]
MVKALQWCVALKPTRPGLGRRKRWLTDQGVFTADPAKTLRVVNAEVAARRLQAFVELRGWPLRAVERLTLVPDPNLA